MSKTKTHMRGQISDIHAGLSSFSIPVFEDEIAEDEEKGLIDYHCFVYETSGMKNEKDMKSLTQAIHIYYYSENRSDIDEQTVDIIMALSGVKGMTLERTEKQRLQKKDTDRFIDRVILTYVRRINIGCQI
ncbi:hypothetical protein [Sporosarcina sp. E16_8]|uniref:hypothetical protein n=1 Tax=Sporosarcina sp. E16_8 TaxID=2789295 RepID=UPI001A910B71|nr:hypothetical protein [Sporosarcina sp. E16_8]MBO0586459.1 hypothetical protein [Sporosarcina sp. E16_8]